MKKTLLFITIVLLSSCEMQKNVSDIYGYDEDCLCNAQELQYTDIQITELDCGKDNPLTVPKKVLVTKDDVLVLDNDRVFRFNKTGKLIKTIGRQGHGNGEYISPSTFYIGYDRLVSIVDTYAGKILKYTIDGEFKESVKIGELATNVQNAESIDNDLLFTSNYIYNKDNKIYNMLNLKEKDASVIAKTEMSTANTKEAIGVHPFSIHNNVIRYILPFDNNIYSINDMTEYRYVTEKRLFALEGQKKINDFSIMTYQKLLEEDMFLGFTDIYETDKYIFTACKNIEYVILNKQERLCKRYNYRLDKNTECFPLYNIIASDNNALYGLINTSELSRIKTYNTDDEYLNKLMKYKDEEDKYLIISYHIK